MSLVKVEGNNTFEWKINNINEKTTSCFSGEFFVDKYDFQVIFHHKFSGYPRLCQFRLYTKCNKVFPVSYTFSILDREGHVFVTSKGKTMSYGSEEQRSLMIIDVSYLKSWNLTESDGTFTVRFSLNCKLDTQEESNPTRADASNVVDSASNTNPLVTKDSSTNTDVSATFLETLSNDFSTFYESKTDTDCVLKVSDAQFRVHRSILSARSSVFSAMFHHDTAESSSGEVNIPDVKATVLSNVLYYVYSGKIRLTVDTATSMYIAADKYDLLELRKECLLLLKHNLTMNNFCEAALLSHMHGEVELEERVLGFIEANLDDVLESNTWQQFSKDNTLIALRMLTSALKHAKKK